MADPAQDPFGGMSVPVGESNLPAPQPPEASRQAGADLARVMEALKRADAAGNTEDARQLAQIADRLRRQDVANRATLHSDRENFTAGDYMQSLGGGINRGLATMAGAPGDLMNLGTEAIGLGRPFGGSKEMTDLVFGSTETGRGMIAPGATDEGGQMLGRIGEEVGATALPGGAILGAATRTAPRVFTAATSVPRAIWGAFANPIRQSPALAATGELVAATGAGTGAHIAQSADPGNRAAETWGQLLGGVAPSLVSFFPGPLITRFLIGTARRFSPSAQHAAARNEVSDLMGGQLTPEAEAGLREAERLGQRIPGFRPSLGEATGSPALLAQQRQVESAATGGTLERLQGRRVDAEGAVARFAEQQAPGAEGAPEFVVDTARKSLDDLRATAKSAEAALKDRQRAIAAGLPTADRYAAGEALRNRLLDIRAQTRARLSLRAEELGIDETNLSAPFHDLRRQIVGEFKPRSVFEDAANTPGILQELKRMGDDEIVTFADIKALRERLSDDLFDVAGGANPNRRQVRTLTLMKERLDDWIENLGGEQFGQAADRWRQFRGEYFDQYIKPFELGAAFKVRTKDAKGAYVTPNERVASTFFAPGEESAAKQFRRAFGSDQEAHASLEAVALDSLREHAVRDGVLKPGLLKDWMRRHDSVLAEFPAIRGAVDNVFNAQRSIEGRQAQLVARQRQIDDMLLAKQLDAYARESKGAEDVLTAALNSPRKMHQLVSALRKKPEAVEALRRNLWGMIAQQDAAGIRRALKENASSLKPLFNASHLKNLEDIAAAREMLERTTVPTGSAAMPRPLAGVEESLGQGIPQLGSRVFAFKSGRMQKGYLALDTILRGIRGRDEIARQQILSEALYDPDVARELAGAIRAGRVTPERAKRLQARFFALGIPYLHEEEQR